MDPIKETTVESSVLNNIDLIISLDQNIVPESLAERLKYSYDGLTDGTSREVYLDTETGDTYVSGNSMGAREYVLTYRIITTKVGEYKVLAYHGGSGYMGSKYFFNGIETNSHTFYQILAAQKVLPS
jgi:hypothetical protein